MASPKDCAVFPARIRRALVVAAVAKGARLLRKRSPPEPSQDGGEWQAYAQEPERGWLWDRRDFTPGDYQPGTLYRP
jgi:hypothetical protein